MCKKIIKVNKIHDDDGEVILEAIAIILIDYFVLVLTVTLFRPCPSYVATFVSKVYVFFCHFGIVVDFERLKLKLKKFAGLKIVVF